MPPNYVFFPALAGFMVQLINLLELRNIEPSRRPNFKDWTYWIPYIIAPILGGFAGYMSFHSNISSYNDTIGAQVGISAPLILKGFASIVKTPSTTNIKTG